jgi:hypothetical protein
MPGNGTSKLSIVRRGGFADSLRPYKIFANGEQVGTIKKNSVLHLDVPSGTIKVEARIDWGESEPLTITAAPGQTIEIEVSNHWGLWLALWGATFGSHSYLNLKQLGSS